MSVGILPTASGAVDSRRWPWKALASSTDRQFSQLGATCRIRSRTSLLTTIGVRVDSATRC